MGNYVNRVSWKISFILHFLICSSFRIRVGVSTGTVFSYPLKRTGLYFGVQCRSFHRVLLYSFSMLLFIHSFISCSIFSFWRSVIPLSSRSWVQWACRRPHSLVRVNHGKPPSKQEKKKIPNLVSRSLFFSPRLQNFFLPSPPHRKKGELLPSVTLKKQPLLLLVVIGSIIIQSISFLSRGHSTPLCPALPCVTLLREALVYFSTLAKKRFLFW